MLNFVQQVCFLSSTEGSLVDTRAYIALYLGGTPSQDSGTSPPSCLLLDNRLYMHVNSKLMHEHDGLSKFENYDHCCVLSLKLLNNNSTKTKNDPPGC